MLPPPVRTSAWTRAELLVVGGAIIALAATAETVRVVYERFAADLAELSVAERAAVALWDLGPLEPAVFAAGVLALLSGLAQRPGRLAGLRRPLQSAVAVLLAAFATLGLVVVALAAWIAADGSLGEADGLGFRFGAHERAVTLATQVLGWGALVVLFVLLALRVTERPESEPMPNEQTSLFEEMDALWRERLAFSPKRERGRTLLARVRALEEAGDLHGAREAADEMRRL